MDICEINNILLNGENTTVEFKKAEINVPESLYETISSFSNRDGGIIILGVDDTGKVLGIEDLKTPKFISNIVTACNTKNCINPSLFISPIRFSHPDGKIIIIEILSYSQVVKHAGKIYWRENDSDIDITNEHAKVSDLYAQKSAKFTETTIYPNLSNEDLDKSLFDEARKIIRSTSPNHPWLKVEDDQLLRESSLYRKDYSLGIEGLTLAAALIFGKDTTIQNLLPAYKVEALVQKENTDRWDDRITLRTNLLDTYKLLMEFIKKHLPEKFYMEGTQRKNLREIIFHEIIGNLIVHREYTSAAASNIIIGQNVVKITNPNIPPFHGPIDLENFSPHPKNPTIRKFFTALGWTEEIGSGIRNTTKYLYHYIPNAKPLFIENDLFTTEIPMIYNNMAMINKQLSEWLELSDPNLDHLQEGLKQITMDPAITTIWPDVLLHLVPSWNTKGTELVELDWPSGQSVTKDEIKLVPGWDEKGTKLIHKKTRYFISLLVSSTNPIQLETMMKWIGYKNKNTFRNNYLKPLQQIEFIKMTNPDNPSDPDQKYVITNKGKLFLGGYYL